MVSDKKTVKSMVSKKNSQKYGFRENQSVLKQASVVRVGLIG